MKTPFFDIVVAVDGSATAQRAIDYAIGIAGDGVTLHFCTVVSDSVIGVSNEQARRVCTDAAAFAAKCGVTADGRILLGAVAPAICRYATDVHADAIAIGTDARSGLERVVFGSVTDALLAISAIPVIVTHVDDALASDGPITLAIDDSTPPRAAPSSVSIWPKPETHELGDRRRHGQTLTVGEIALRKRCGDRPRTRSASSHRRTGVSC